MYDFDPEKSLRLAIFFGIGEIFNLAILLLSDKRYFRIFNIFLLTK